MKTWLDILCSLRVGSRDSSLFHRARRQTACPRPGPHRRAAWPKTHLLVTSVTCCLRDKAAWLRAVTSVQKKLQSPYLKPENCVPVNLVSSGTSVDTAQSSFLILTLTEISKAGVKHTYLGQIALTQREPLATDDACLIDLLVDFRDVSDQIYQHLRWAFYRLRWTLT